MEERYMLELRGVSRRISSEFYLRGINLALRPGEVHALVGRNASGKSTLFSTIMGVFTPDRGQVLIDGQPAEIRNTSDAVKNGLILVAQHQQMFANLPVYENLFFGNELRMGGKLGLVDNRRMLHRCEEVFRQMNVQIDPRAPMGNLTDAERQLTAIARAIVTDGRIILLDEPSTHLNESEKQRLYDAIAGLKQEGRAFLIISHDLNEVLAVADTISVMEDGEIVRSAPAGEFDEKALIEAVYGIKSENIYYRERPEAGKEVLRLEDFSGPNFSGVSLSLRAGQVTAFMGGAQSGKLSVARSLAGLCKTGGRVYLNGGLLEIPSPITAVRAGIVLASSQADEEEIRESEIAVNAGKRDTSASRMAISAKRLMASVGKALGNYVMLRPQQEYITGGNRQRELVERAMRKQAFVYLLCEPTAGVDIPAKMRLYFEMNKLLQKGAAVLWLTADIDEAFGLCDNIAVMRDGGLALSGSAAELSRGAVQEAIGAAAQ